MGKNSDIDVRSYRNALNDNYIIVLTSNSIEKEAVNKIIKNRHGAIIGRDHRGCSFGLIEKRFVLHVTGDSGISKTASIGRILSYLLSSERVPEPAFLILAGFCWGNPKFVEEGSVIVCDELVSVNLMHATNGGYDAIGHTYPSKIRIIGEAKDYVTSALGESNIKGYVGPLASAEILYKDDLARDKFLAQYPDVLGGEMEAFAFVDSDLPWLIVKAVSDFGGTSFSRERQPIAARNAADSLFPLIELLEKQNLVQKIR